MAVCGIDLGSRKVKLVIGPDGPGQTEAGWSFAGLVPCLEFHSYDTIEFYRDFGAKQGDSLVIDFAGLGLPHFNKVVSTGYGRNTLNVRGGQIIPELRAHVNGAILQTGLPDFTLLDLGGQDSKIIKVRKGRMVDFLTNDKCAASSGRYLENMAVVLGITLNELGRWSEDPVELSSTCAVFGESELIGKIVEGHPVANLAAGVNYTIFDRVKPMLRQQHSPVLVFTGGVARSPALQTILARELDVEVVVPEFPEYNGALGCWDAAASG